MARAQRGGKPGLALKASGPQEAYKYDTDYKPPPLKAGSLSVYELGIHCP